MRLKITGRLMAQFAAVLLVFALVVGLLFSLMFRDFSLRLYQDSLTRQALQIAQSLSRFERGAPRGGYSSLMPLLSEAAQSDMWLVDRQGQTVSMGRRQIKLSNDRLPDGHDKLLNDVFEGKTVRSSDFSGLLMQPTITVATPVTEPDGEVRLALLMHAAAAGTDEAVARGLTLLGYATLIGLVLAVMAAALLAHHFIRPIKAMQVAANHMAEGDYDMPVPVTRRDELGALAQDLNRLSVSLSQARDESDVSEQRRRDFLSSVSHELRTPVTVLLGTLEAIDDGVIKDDEAIGQSNKAMLAETRHLRHLVDDLLSLSRLQNPDFAFETAAIDIKSLLSQVAQAGTALGVARDVKVEIGVCDTAPLAGDATQIKQLAMILVDNAVKVSPTGGRVQLSWQAKEAGGVLSVSDQGPGIEDKDMPRLFERFYSASKAGQPQGTGLGLAIAKAIAERHGADIGAVNRPEGGAVFSVRFPSEQAPKT